MHIMTIKEIVEVLAHRVPCRYNGNHWSNNNKPVPVYIEYITFINLKSDIEPSMMATGLLKYANYGDDYIELAGSGNFIISNGVNVLEYMRFHEPDTRWGKYITHTEVG